MSFLAPAIDRSSAALSSINLMKRCSDASEYLWLVENLSVVMPFVESAESKELRAMIQAIGLTVLNGLDSTLSDDCESLNTEQSALVVVHVSDWKIAINRQKLTTGASLNPMTLCVVTGLVPLLDHFISQQFLTFNDARLLLAAAGIGFFSTEGFSNGLVA